MSLIKAHHLSKHFRVYQHRRGTWSALRNFFSPSYTLVRAVEDVSFQIGRGELVGYIGPNRVGKSTTIRMLTRILVPASGQVVVDGRVLRGELAED